MKKPITLLTLALAGVLTLARAGEPAFFAMDTGTKDATHHTPEQQVALVQEVGFAGITPIYQNSDMLRDMLTVLDQRKLKMFAVYVPLDLHSPTPVSPAIRDVIQQLRGRHALLWLYINFPCHRPRSSSPRTCAANKDTAEGLCHIVIAENRPILEDTCQAQISSTCPVPRSRNHCALPGPPERGAARSDAVCRKLIRNSP